jgi:hypothetical protein
MPKVTRQSLMTLEAYAKERPAFRARVIGHKQRRKVELGSSISLQFEDELSIRYQIQEMLRVERTFEEAGIQEELDAYNPLIPDGKNLKATMMLEFPDPEERKQWLARLIGVEDRVWLQVHGQQKVWAVADEDLDRENDEKTSSVHFLRFELDDAMIAAFKGGAAMELGIDHPNYQASSQLSTERRDALAKDLA